MPKGVVLSFLSTVCVCAQAPQAAVAEASASNEAAQLQQSGPVVEDSSSTAAAAASLDQPAPTS